MNGLVDLPFAASPVIAGYMIILLFGRNGWLTPVTDMLGVKIVLPRVSPQPYTRLAFEGALFAAAHGAARPYNHRMFTAFFQEERDIGDPAVLGELAEEIGLDRAAFDAALERRAYREPCAQLLHHAYETLGVSSVPTIVIGRRAVAGLVPQERLEAMIAVELEAAET